AARYTDEFESEWVGWHFDIGNIVAYGWPEQWIRILGHRIHKIDAKEYSREKMNREGKGKGFAVNLLEGDCGWPKVMAALDEIGYTARDEAWMAAEVPGGDADRLRDISERMDRIAAS
ncbi:MAG: sugar phosphate isomerase/epimerase, partial [Planctomycetes bacterium]|nr:sugar phosphate isomerase/epimerase [Planctomycetota bacterium]